MIAIKNYKKVSNYIALCTMGLFLMFIASAIDMTGTANFVCYIIMVSFLYAVTRKYCDIILFSCAVFINSELLNGSLGPFSIRKVFIVLLLFSFLFNIVKKGYRFRLCSRISVPIFSMWMLYSFWNILFLSNTGFVGLLNYLILFLIAIVTQLITVDDDVVCVKLIWTVFIAFSLIIFVSILEQTIGHTIFYSRWTVTERYRNGILRAGSTLGDPNNVCYMLVPFLFVLQTNVVKKVVPTTIRKFTILADFIVIILTSSRAGLVALLVGIAFVIFGKRRAIFLLLVPISGFIANYGLQQYEMLLSKYQESTNYRQYIVSQAMIQWNQHKLTGVGSSALFDAIGLSNTMNTYVYVLGIFGIIGMIFYILYWYYMIHKDVKSWLLDKHIEKDGLLRIAVVITSAIMAYSLDVFGMGLMWLTPVVFQVMDSAKKNSWY